MTDSDFQARMGKYSWIYVEEMYPDDSQKRCIAGVAFMAGTEAARADCDKDHESLAQLVAVTTLQLEATQTQLAIAEKALQDVLADSDDCCLEHGYDMTCCRKESASIVIADEALAALKQTQTAERPQDG